MISVFLNKLNDFHFCSINYFCHRFANVSQPYKCPSLWPRRVFTALSVIWLTIINNKNNKNKPSHEELAFLLDNRLPEWMVTTSERANNGHFFLLILCTEHLLFIFELSKHVQLILHIFTMVLKQQQRNTDIERQSASTLLWHFKAEPAVVV